MRIIDISQPVGTATAVWPGDHPFRLAWSMRRARGDSVNVAVPTLSVHTGTHIDGFRHIDDEGAAAGEMPLGAYLGPCTVVDARGASALGPEHVAHLDLGRIERILFRTRDEVDETRFPERFAHITPELARLLAEVGLRLVGSDAPSMDPQDSRQLDTHHILAAAGVANLENAVLTDVTAGDYILVALPLRFVEADSSPVRAVLLAGASAW